MEGETEGGQEGTRFLGWGKFRMSSTWPVWKETAPRLSAILFIYVFIESKREKEIACSRFLIYSPITEAGSGWRRNLLPGLPQSLEPTFLAFPGPHGQEASVMSKPHT